MDEVLSNFFPEPLDGGFFKGAKLFLALPPSGPPKGGKSPSDDWVLKSPLLVFRSGSDGSIELKEDDVDEDLEVANCCDALWILVSALVVFLGGS